MKQKKVVHITTVHHPYDTRIYHKECLSLAEAGYDVTLIVTDHQDLKKQSDDKIDIKVLTRPTNRFTRFIKSSIEAYKTAKKIDADIYHFHDPELIFVGRLLKNNNNIVIYDVHEDYESSINQKQYLPRPLRFPLSKLITFIEKQFTKPFEKCLAEKYYSEKIPEGKHILNYPIIRSTEKNSSTNPEKDESETRLIYTGNVTVDRGALVHAKLPLLAKNISVIYVGKCSEGLANRIYETAGEEKDSLHINGINKFVPREEIDQTYTQSKWLAGLALFPPTEHYMKKELTKFFEYMQVGLPIICSNFPTWQQFIDKYQCGIAVDPYNDKEIKKAIQYLINNPQKAKEMGENGRTAVLTQLNWDVEKKKLVHWYNELLNSN